MRLSLTHSAQADSILAALEKAGALNLDSPKVADRRFAHGDIVQALNRGEQAIGDCDDASALRVMHAGLKEKWILPGEEPVVRSIIRRALESGRTRPAP